MTKEPRLLCYSIRVTNVPLGTGVKELLSSSNLTIRNFRARTTEEDDTHTVVFTIKGKREEVKKQIDVHRLQKEHHSTEPPRLYYYDDNFSKMTPLNNIIRDSDTVEYSFMLFRLIVPL